MTALSVWLRDAPPPPPHPPPAAIRPEQPWRSSPLFVRSCRPPLSVGARPPVCAAAAGGAAGRAVPAALDTRRPECHHPDHRGPRERLALWPRHGVGSRGRPSGADADCAVSAHRGPAVGAIPVRGGLGGIGGGGWMAGGVASLACLPLCRLCCQWLQLLPRPPARLLGGGWGANRGGEGAVSGEQEAGGVEKRRLTLTLPRAARVLSVGTTNFCAWVRRPPRARSPARAFTGPD